MSMSKDSIDFGSLNAEAKKSIRELVNLSSNIIDDGEVSDAEIKALGEWMGRNGHLKDKWPLSKLFPLLQKIQEDGQVDEHERLQLMSVFSGLSIFAKE